MPSASRSGNAFTSTVTISSQPGTAWQCPRYRNWATTAPLVRGSGAVLLYMPPKARRDRALIWRPVPLPVKKATNQKQNLPLTDQGGLSLIGLAIEIFRWS